MILPFLGHRLGRGTLIVALALGIGPPSSPSSSPSSSSLYLSDLILDFAAVRICVRNIPVQDRLFWSISVTSHAGCVTSQAHALWTSLGLGCDWPEVSLFLPSGSVLANTHTPATRQHVRFSCCC